MNGQGRPNWESARGGNSAGQAGSGSLARMAAICAVLAKACAGALKVCAVLATVCALFTAAPQSHAQETDLRLRIAWGGGAARMWRGSISVSEGELSNVVPLGLEADEPGSMVIDGRRIRIAQPSPRAYDGMDVTVRAPLAARITVELESDGDAPAPKPVEFALGDLVAGTHVTQLDGQDNRVIAQRAPGDSLRLEFARDSLVFSPGEVLELTVAPHHCGTAAAAWVQMKMQIVRARSDEELWSETHDLRAGDDGSLEPVGPVHVPLPRAEGVYDVVVTITPWRIRAPLVRARPLAQRKLQLVVIDPRPPETAATAWAEQVAIDPANPGWWDRLMRVSHLTALPGMGSAPRAGGTHRVVAYGSSNIVELAPGAWRAYPLPVDRVGTPHVLEVEYPATQRQTLGISIVEPNAAGEVIPIGLDSGVDVEEADENAPPRLARHRLVFWPRTKSPLVLLTNLRDDVPSAHGKLRVLSGPDVLPPAARAAAITERGTTAGNAHRRLLAAYYDKPLFPENFGADEALDSPSPRTVDDWGTFYQGGKRLVEYLKHAGYNGAVISVACEGSTIYPSRLLEPTPKYDTGVFFTTGQDPIRKDALEMLMRLFDREGLTLVPAVQFSGPLPALEAMRREAAADGGGDNRAGIDLTDSSGRTWIDRFGARRGMAPYYNPLDERVQQAMVAVVEEIASRYAGHEAFGGVALQLGPDTYGQLPGETWACDDATVRRFARETGTVVPGGEGAAARRAEVLEGDHRVAWLKWRSQSLAALHVKMQQAVAAERSNARLYLAGADLTAAADMQKALRPTLPARGGVAEALLLMGLDSANYRNKPGIVFLRPRRSGPLLSLTSQAANLELAGSPESDRCFTPDGSALLLYRESIERRVPSFDEVSPFGPDKTSMWLVAHVAPAEFRGRRRLAQSLAAADVRTVMDGGWMLTLGQEDAMRPVLEVLAALPDEPFETVPEPQSGASQGVVLRKLTHGDRTYLYAVNSSPWPVVVDFEVRGKADTGLARLATGKALAVRRLGDSVVSTFELEPFDLQAAVATVPGVEVVRWSVRVVDSESVIESLHRRLGDVRSRAAALRNPSPVEALANPGFELPDAGRGMPGWVHARAPDITVVADAAESHSGERSLRLTSAGSVAWVRSAPFDPPRGGRVAVWAWMRIDNADKQPPLRLAIEGRVNGQEYYKFAALGEGRNAQPLTTEWKPYLFPIDNLPPTGLNELRVGFDMMGEGQVWIDDVLVFDLWFQDNERDELRKMIALADLHLSEGRLVDCQRFLQTYWPRFLMEYVEVSEPRTAIRDLPAVAGETPPATPPAEPAEPTTLDRIRRFVPKMLRLE